MGLSGAFLKLSLGFLGLALGRPGVQSGPLKGLKAVLVTMLGHLGAFLKLSWGCLKLSTSPHKPVLGHLRAILGGFLGRPRTVLSPILDHLGTILEHS